METKRAQQPSTATPARAARPHPALPRRAGRAAAWRARDLLRLLLLVQGMAAAALAAALQHWRGWPWDAALAAGFAAVVLVRLLIFSNNFLLSASAASATPAPFRPGAVGWLRLMCEEFAASMLQSSWYGWRDRACMRVYVRAGEDAVDADTADGEAVGGRPGQAGERAADVTRGPQVAQGAQLVQVTQRAQVAQRPQRAHVAQLAQRETLHGEPGERVERVAGASAPGVPVLLLHGYGCTSGYWHTLVRRLQAQTISYATVDLDPLGASIDDYVAQVERASAALRAATGAPRIAIVAHSMGGLVARAWLRGAPPSLAPSPGAAAAHPGAAGQPAGDAGRASDAGQARHGAGVDHAAHAAGVDHAANTDPADPAARAAQLARLITLGTPHHGTILANFGIGINAAQMRRARHGCSSAWLRALDAGETPALRALMTSIYSHQDNIVAPQTSSCLQGARLIAVGGVGHVALGSNGRVLDCVMAELALLQ